MSDYDNLGRPTDHSPAAIRARYEAASRHVDDLCARRERWTMHVPVDPGRDSDMVISNALEDVPWLLAELDRQVGELDHATRFEFSDLPDGIDGSTWGVAAEYRGHGRWAVIHLGSVLGADGEWDPEPIPSYREDDWLDAHRFDRDTALRLAAQHSHTVVVNGMTAADVLARKAAKETQ